ncbi:MAG: peptide-methionine (S)-S-oxide reductase MsrA [Xanthobacteraceae bacterium]|jgi:peptide-methionine (S)-S-oxide reductase
MADRIWPGAGEGRGLSLRALACATLFVSLLGLATTMPAQAAEPAAVIPAPALDPAAPAGSGLQTIVLAGGCFWGPQEVYQHVKGVTQALAGSVAGQKATARSGDAEPVEDAESVQVTFDPRQISLGKILQIYFSVVHNPTELNYQGPDVGTQYRSEIFYGSDAQKRVAEAYIAQLNAARVFAAAIVTKVEALPEFNPAADSDQDYAVSHPDDSYVVAIDQPKIANLKRLFADDYRETPITVLASNKPTE